VNRKDPLEYYSLLGISPTASDAEIKTAFRKRAKDLHPDRNPSPYAVQQFQQLGEAFEVLSNPEARARYDTWYAENPQESTSAQQTPLEPIVCSCCGSITAQPRYVIFYQVTSLIAVTIRSPVQGIFCPGCAEGKVLRSTIITWLAGWWGLPWGVIYSVHAIIHNLSGGSKPDDVNARLLIHQAYFFATQNKLNLAHAIAIEAKTFAYRATTNEGFELRNLVDKLLAALESIPVERLQNTWAVPNRPFYLQTAILAIFVVLAGAVLQTQPQTSSSLPSNATNNSPVPSSPVAPQYVRPSSADNGVPFPVTSDYISGYQQQFTDGYSRVTVDNSQNDSDVFVKLFSIDTEPPEPIRVFFIRANETFTVENVRAGNYDVRYRDLDSGGLSRTERFNLNELRGGGVVSYSQLTLSLYKVRDGNMQTYSILENEF
jgi:hypothetical protein